MVENEDVPERDWFENLGTSDEPHPPRVPKPTVGYDTAWALVSPNGYVWGTLYGTKHGAQTARGLMKMKAWTVREVKISWETEDGREEEPARENGS